jgi:hypothetical protein
MRTIASGWRRFDAQITPQGASDEQRFDLRNAFYAGATTVLGIMRQISAQEVSDDAGIAILEGLHQEVRAFALDLKQQAAVMRDREANR